MKYLPLIGRILFSLIFIFSGIAHISGQGVDLVAAKGFPLPLISTIFGGVLSLLGGLSVALGYKSNIGTLLLIGFLIIASFCFHAFWNETDPAVQHISMAMFMKNLALIGAAIFIHVNGTGDMSLDNKEV